jgi:hypothetical protein
MIVKLAPPFVVRRIIPSSPPMMPLEASQKKIVDRFRVVPDETWFQVVPPSVDLRIIPFCPTAK